MRTALGVFVVLFAASVTSFGANSTSTIKGRVSDADGTFLGHALVQIQSSDGKHKYKTRTDQTGSYSYGGLRPGQYHVWVEVDDLGRRAVDLDISPGDTLTVDLKLPVALPAGGKQNQSTQDSITSGCIVAKDIYNFQAGPYLLQGTVIQNPPYLKAMIWNGCTTVVSVWATLAYYDQSGVQVDTKLENATIAPGTQYSLQHILDCAQYGGSCTPQRWRTRIRIIKIQVY